MHTELYIYSKDGKVKVLTYEQAKGYEATVLLMNGYKHTETIDPQRYIESLFNKEMEINKYEGVLLGLKICKEMFTQGTITHEDIRENEIYYQELINQLNET